jgi:tRNA(fMet)-specific endonuclease VapC
MLRYVLDTNICIFTIKNKPPHLRSLFNTHATQMCVSQVTVMELYYGAYRSQQVERNLSVIEGFLARLPVIPYDTHAADHTAQIRSELASRGTPIGPYDAMIAGNARSQGLIVVTNNTREFSRVEGLRVEDWLERT